MPLRNTHSLSRSDCGAQDRLQHIKTGEINIAYSDLSGSASSGGGTDRCTAPRPHLWVCTFANGTQDTKNEWGDEKECVSACHSDGAATLAAAAGDGVGRFAAVISIDVPKPRTFTAAELGFRAPPPPCSVSAVDFLRAL